jgi:hypothetical protein
MMQIKKWWWVLPIFVGSVLLAWAGWPRVWGGNTQLVGHLVAAEFYKTVGGSVVLLAGLQFGLMTLLKVRIEESVKHENAKKLEDYRNDIKIREQAAKVAQLLAHVRWHDGKGNEELDRMAWELSLWLPTDLCCRLTEALVKNESVGDFKQVLIDVRKLLLKDQAGDLKAENIPHLNNK